MGPEEGIRSLLIWSNVTVRQGFPRQSERGTPNSLTSAVDERAATKVSEMEPPGRQAAPVSKHSFAYLRASSILGDSQSEAHKPGRA